MGEETITVEEGEYTLDDARAVYAAFAGQCMEMNEAQLTTALGAALRDYDSLRARVNALEVENARLVETLECRAAFEMEMLGAAKRHNYQKRLYDECVTANWDPEQRNTFAEEIAHLHEELSEAFRAWRKYKDFDVRTGPSGKLEGVPIELADVLIGLFYNAELHGFDLFAAVEQKHRFNLNRNYVAEGRQLHAPALAEGESPEEKNLGR